MSIQQQTLANGLTIIGEPKSSAQSMAAGYFVRTGARDESPEVSGVSHFLEHMMFKGTARRSPEDVNREFDEMGAHYNAFTSEENTVYYGAVLPEFQGRLLDLLSDMMRPSLRDEDFNVEKKVILEEIALYQDRPQFTAVDLARHIHYDETPLGFSILGTTRSVGALERDQMRRYFDRRYVPGNMTLTLTGRYDWDAAVPQVDAACAAWGSAAAGRDHPSLHPRSRTHIVTDRRLNRAHLAFAAPGLSAQDPRHRAAGVLAEIIGGSRGSRLYWALIEPGLADTAQLFHDEGDGAGWFGAYLSCDPADAEEVRSRFVKVLEEASHDGIRPDEVSRVTRKIAAGHVIGGETPMGRLTSVGFDWVYRGVVESVDEEADALLAVSAADCGAILDERPFTHLTMVVLGPVGASLEPAGVDKADGTDGAGV
ncbi:MAG TPA: pitrilysin family protein [Armatimonadota bacterium]|nr:pitrilysin family protein [Armatimonadota bacterium]